MVKQDSTEILDTAAGIIVSDDTEHRRRSICFFLNALRTQAGDNATFRLLLLDVIRGIDRSLRGPRTPDECPDELRNSILDLARDTGTIVPLPNIDIVKEFEHLLKRLSDDESFVYGTQDGIRYLTYNEATGKLVRLRSLKR